MLFSNTLRRLSTRAMGFKATRMAFVTSHLLDLQSCTPRVHLLRAATASSHLRFTFLHHAHRDIYLQTVNSQVSSQSHVQTFPSSTQFSFLHASKPTVVNDPAPLSPAKTFPSGNRKCTRNWNPCAHRYNSRAGRNWDHQRRNRLFTHTDQ